LGGRGEAPTVPTTLRVPGERNVGSTQALAPSDQRSLKSPPSRDVTYQRYDVAVHNRTLAPVLRLEGTIDPTRVLTLHAWNADTHEWDALASSRGEPEGSTVLSAGVARRYLDRRQVHVLVTGQDPFADDLDASGRQGLDDPAGYDFSMVHLTDTQYLSEGAVEQETAEERAVWEEAYGDVTRWIRGHAQQRKIRYVAHTGDLVENNIRPPATPEMERQITDEFEVSSRLQQILDESGVVNGVIAGNHDNQSGRENGPSAQYNNYFGPDRYTAASRAWEDASYGGAWREGDNQNHYDLFSAGGLEFVVVGLSYGITREEADWADRIFKQFPDRNGILLSHDYIRPSSSPDGRGGTLSAPDGSLLHNTIVADNPNVFLVLAGHEHGVATNVKPDAGVVGNGVVELLADYQSYEVTAERLGLTDIGGYPPNQGLRFGASFFRMLQFDVARSELSVDTYSPFLDEFGATEYDANQRYDGREDTMVLPVDLTTRRTRFATDSLAVYAPTGLIGRDRVRSGEVASVTWNRLRPDTAYAWFVTAISEGGGIASSDPQVFATADSRGRPSDALLGFEASASGRGPSR
jgi:predicted MPP superfamily phosphohydrolase